MVAPSLGLDAALTVGGPAMVVLEAWWAGRAVLAVEVLEPDEQAAIKSPAATRAPPQRTAAAGRPAAGRRLRAPRDRPPAWPAPGGPGGREPGPDRAGTTRGGPDRVAASCAPRRPGPGGGPGVLGAACLSTWSISPPTSVPRRPTTPSPRNYAGGPGRDWPPGRPDPRSSRISRPKAGTRPRRRRALAEAQPRGGRAGLADQDRQAPRRSQRTTNP